MPIDSDQMPRIGGRRAKIFARADLIVTAALMAAVANFSSVLRRVPPSFSSFNYLDGSFLLDIAYRGDRGLYIGRDFVTYYGPLYQFLSGLAPRIDGFSLGSFYRNCHFLPYWSSFLLTYATAAVALNRHALWKRVFYIVALVAFWSPADIRPSFAVFTLALCLRLMQMPDDDAWLIRRAITRGALLTVTVVTGFLISIDTGMYAVAVCAIASAATLLFARSRAERWHAFAVAATTLVLGIVCAPFIAALAGGFSMIAEMTREYRWWGGIPFTPWILLPRLVATAAVCIAVLAVGWHWRDPASSSVVRRPAFVIASLLFGTFALQAALVRSDEHHFGLGIFPLIALAGLLLMGTEREAGSLRGDLPVLVALLITAACSGRSEILAPANVVAGLTAPARPCEAGTFLLDGACFTKSDYDKLRTVSDYLAAHTAPNERVLIFPYEHVYAVLARRVVSGGVIVTMTRGALLRREIAAWESDRPPIAVYSQDPAQSLALEEVPNFTRNPDRWFYVQRHYQTEVQIQPGLLILRRDEPRGESWRMTSRVVLTEPRVVAPKSKAEIKAAERVKGELKVADLQWPADADFLRLQLTVHYPMWFRLAKPARMFVVLHRADGTVDSAAAVVPPDEGSQVWIFPWRREEMPRYFSARSADWRAQSRSPIVSVGLRFDRMADPFCALPRSVQVQRFEAVTVSLVH